MGVSLGGFLDRRALARPAEPPPANLKSDLVALGLSARESDVVELLLLGLSHKEIGERLFISPDTVRKHLSESVETYLPEIKTV